MLHQTPFHLSRAHRFDGPFAENGPGAWMYEDSMGPGGVTAPRYRYYEGDPGGSPWNDFGGYPWRADRSLGQIPQVTPQPGEPCPDGWYGPAWPNCIQVPGGWPLPGQPPGGLPLPGQPPGGLPLPGYVTEAECQRRVEEEKSAGLWQSIAIGAASAVAGAVVSFALTKIVK